MSAEVLAILEQAKTELLADATLSSNYMQNPDPVTGDLRDPLFIAIDDYDVNALPDFDRYALLLFLQTEEEAHDGGHNSKEGVYTIGIAAIVRRYDKLKSCYGSQPPDMGLIQLVHDAKEALRSSMLNDLIDLTKNEFDDPVEYRLSYSEARKEYYREATIPYRVRTEPAEMPDPH
jgi:hypothetical protein